MPLDLELAIPLNLIQTTSIPNREGQANNYPHICGLWTTVGKVCILVGHEISHFWTHCQGLSWILFRPLLEEALNYFAYVREESLPNFVGWNQMEPNWSTILIQTRGKGNKVCLHSMHNMCEPRDKMPNGKLMGRFINGLYDHALQYFLITQMCKSFCWSLVRSYDLWGVKEENLEKGVTRKIKIPPSINNLPTAPMNQMTISMLPTIIAGNDRWFIIVSECMHPTIWKFMVNDLATCGHLDDVATWR